MTTSRRIGSGLAALALATAGVATFAAPAIADNSVPFNDPNVAGTLGFCDKNDKPLTSGSILDVPFAFKAVSDVPAAKAYAVKGGKATLYIYSPIKGVSPGEWVSYQLVPSSLYTNVTKPMVGAGYGEPPLEYPVTNAPPTWDGLMQIRMLLSAPNTPQQTDPYPAAVIRVTDKTWTLVQGNRTPDCTAGKAVNMNQVLGGKEPTAPPTWAANSTAKPASGSASPSSSVATPGSTTPGSGSSEEAAAPLQSSTSSSSVNVLPIALGLLGATVIGVGGFALLAARRSR